MRESYESTSNVVIEPVHAGIARTKWSVMIPTFNCANYLKQTLECVLAQDPGADQMQIEVIDDCSTKDDPEAVVRTIGKDRVKFYRNPANKGATANFNTCIERSRGQLVHILHGDDLVISDFYSQMGSLISQHPDIALFASSAFIIDENGHVTGAFRAPKRMKHPSRNCAPFYYATPIQCASVVVRRTLYEKLGGFNPSLVHAADCEMWARAVGSGGGVVMPEPLAYYRVFGQNDTARIARTGENLRDMERLGKIFEDRYSDFSKYRHRKRLARMAWKQAEHFRRSQETDGYETNIAYWKGFANFFQKARRFPKMLYRNFISRK